MAILAASSSLTKCAGLPRFLEAREANVDGDLVLGLLPMVDYINCPTDPVVHDRRGPSHPVLAKQRRRYADFLKNDYEPLRSPGTFIEDDIYVTLPDGGNLVFWGQRDGVDGAWTPIFDISAWYIDNNQIVIPDLGTYTVESYTWNFVHPGSQDSSFVEQTITLEGDYAVLITGWWYAYQHQLIDCLGYLVYLSRTLPSTTRILIPSWQTETLPAILEAVDPELAHRVDFIDCQTFLMCHNKKYQVKNGTLKILKPKSLTRHLELYELVRSWLWNSPKIKKLLKENNNCNEKTIIYYNRTPKGTGFDRVVNARYMDRKQEIEIQNRIKHAMARYNRSEKFVVFDGHMSFEEQILLFHSATTVIGPHGGGLANILLMAPSKVTNDKNVCQERPKVLEFVTNSETPQVQKGDIVATYYTLYSTCPWVELHQVLFVPPSNPDFTFIDMDAFDDALKSILGGSSSSSYAVSV